MRFFYFVWKSLYLQSTVDFRKLVRILGAVYWGSTVHLSFALPSDLVFNLKHCIHLIYAFINSYRALYYLTFGYKINKRCTVGNCPLFYYKWLVLCFYSTLFAVMLWMLYSTEYSIKWYFSLKAEFVTAELLSNNSFLLFFFLSSEKLTGQTISGI